MTLTMEVKMNIWHDIDPALITPERFMAVIEIKRGGKNKYELTLL